MTVLVELHYVVLRAFGGNISTESSPCGHPLTRLVHRLLVGSVGSVIGGA